MKITVKRNRTNIAALWYPGNGIAEGAWWAVIAIPYVIRIYIEW